MGLHRRFLKTTVFALILGFVFSISNLYADAPAATDSGLAHKGPNVSIDSNDLEPYDLNKKSDPEQKPVLYSDGNTTVGFNDDAQPNVGVRF